MDRDILIALYPGLLVYSAVTSFALLLSPALGHRLRTGLDQRLARTAEGNVIPAAEFFSTLLYLSIGPSLPFIGFLFMLTSLLVLLTPIGLWIEVPLVSAVFVTGFLLVFVAATAVIALRRTLVFARVAAPIAARRIEPRTAMRQHQ